MRRSATALAILLAVLSLGVLVTAPPARAAGVPATVTYRPPVDAPIVDPFRPPPEDWNPGNRGLEYATTPGTPVAASAAGEVVFAGQVGGTLHVVVLHDDGIRTSYSFLSTIAVHRGDKVQQGQTLGTSGDSFHFGARAGDAYLDPAKLFGGGPPEVYLVPDEVRRPGSEAQERSGLLGFLKATGAWAVDSGSQAVAWARDQTAAGIADGLDELRGAIHFAAETRPLTHLVRFAAAADAWWRSQANCTPASTPAPRLQERHIAVLVGGLGSTSDPNAVDKVDKPALGYADSDVVRFSYNGGVVPPPKDKTSLDTGGIPQNRYTATDTTADIRQSARRLRELLEELEALHPGVPVDIIAHSQGGVVARTALTDEVGAGDPRLPAVAALITLSTPNQGAPIATLLTMAGHTTSGQVVESGVHGVLPDMVDPAGTSITQLAEESDFMRELNSRPLPAGLKVTAIGARGDLMVPAGVAHLDGANNVIVSVPGYFDEHSELPGSAQATREIALGLAGMPPTCQSWSDALADFAVSDSIRTAETLAGLDAWMAGHLADSRLGELPQSHRPEEVPLMTTTRPRLWAVVLLALLGASCHPGGGGAATTGAAAANTTTTDAGARRVVWVWHAPAPSSIGMPAADDREVAFTYAHQHLVLLDAKGVARWDVVRLGVRDVAPRLTADLVVAATDDGMAAFRRSDGAKVWDTALQARANTPVIVGAVAVTSTWEGELIGLDMAGGKVLWRLALGGSAIGPPATDGTTVVVTWEEEHGRAGGAVAVDGASGRQRWASPLTTGGISGPVVTPDGLVVAVAGDLAAHGLALATGQERWRTTVDGAGSPEVPPVVAGGGMVLTAQRLGGLDLLDAATGRRTWQIRTDGAAVRGGPVVGPGGSFAFPLDDGRLLLAGPQRATELRQAPGRISGIAVGPDQLLVGATTGAAINTAQATNAW